MCFSAYVAAVLTQPVAGQLSIKGIRSFAPDNTDVIEFFKPLTIIVGHNGAGKTVRSSCVQVTLSKGLL